MQASKLAQSAGVSKDTLRYYERLGVITPPPRTANGYRNYNQSHLKQLKFIKFAQSAGFPLSKIKEAIPFLDNPNPTCPKLRQSIEEQLQAIDEKIAELHGAKATLQKWISHTYA